MNQKTYALSGIEKFKQRMQRGGNAQTKMPATSAGTAGAAVDKLRRSTTPNLMPKKALDDGKMKKQNGGGAREPSLNKSQTLLVQKKQDAKRPPKFMQKMKIEHLMGNGGQPSDQEKPVGIKSEGADVAKTESAKQTPNTATLDQIMDHHGSTASFAIKETFEKIQAKLESAQRRQQQFDFGRRKGGQADGSKQFEVEAPSLLKINQCGEHDADEADDAREAGECSGGGPASRVRGKRSRSSRRGEPIQEVEEFESGEEMEESNRGIEALDQTPPALNESTQKSKKTRMGSTDVQGNRLSNMPGEGRPSLASVTPYDDHPDQLVTKVEKIISEAQQAKANARRRTKANTQKEYENSLAQLKGEREELANSKKALKNGGQPIERTNFVRINQNKMANYKPALRGAAFQNKIMAKKSNVMKFRKRQQAKIMAERSANTVSAYGGLGSHGLDFGEQGCSGGAADKQKELEGSFSRTAMQFATVKSQSSEEEDLLVGGDIQEEVKEQLKKIGEELEEVQPADEDDRAPHEIPDDDAGYEKVLREEFGHQSFREGQLKAIKILLEQKRNALVVLATGGGKSLCYQFASRFLPGLVLVVTPLISLMTDQLQKLPDFIPGAALNSQQQFSTKQDVIKAVQQRKIKVLFITPERLFMEDLGKFGRQISMVCVDEIHCSSEWSHNFRPAYLVLHDMIKEKLGVGTAVIGLTATATRAAQEQICQIFDIKYPEHIVTQVDLSRMNLQLSITRDSEKQTALLALLRSPSYQNLGSILIFATQRRTTDQLAAILNQHGIKSSSYHAGKTDGQRSYIQKDFIAGRTRILCCTIAFSMGIDKSDIESVIHYDIPRSIENYVQEIGRAGRDGKLARCHMFLRNEDFYQLRRITLSDLLDSQSALQLTNKIIVEAKKKFHEQKFAASDSPQPKAQTKKRKRNEVCGGLDSDQEEGEGRIIEEFKQESSLKDVYQEKNGVSFIDVAEQLQEQEGKKLFVAIGVKSLLSSLDLKKEVVLTMLNQLEKLKGEKRFMRVDSILPVGVQLRFFKTQLDELVEREADLPRSQQIYTCFQKLAIARDGVFRCHLLDLANELGVKPYSIPKMLYQLQHGTKDDVAYDLDRESFVIEFTRIPNQRHIFELTEEMLAETRIVEQNLISKLNCMYFAARKVSLPSVDYMLRIENEAFEAAANAGGERVVQSYVRCSEELNDLMNLYFSARKEDDVELKIAGNAEDRALMMPLLYIDGDAEAKQQIAEYMQKVLADFHHGEKTSRMLIPSNRMKPLDVVKVLMGINSSRESVRRFQYVHALWAKCHEYDYDQMLKVAEETVQGFYCEALAAGQTPGKPPNTLAGKRKKVEDDDESAANAEEGQAGVQIE